MLDAPCPSHPEQLARSTCERCGSYACHTCLAPGERSEPLCTSCEATIVQQTAPRVSKVGKVTVVLLIVVAALKLANLGAVLLAGDQNAPAALGLAGLGELLHVVCFIAWCMWFNRANKALKARQFVLAFGPNAWGWFFAPFANLVQPYFAVAELQELSTGDAFSRRDVQLWWGLFIAAAIVNWVLMVGASSLVTVSVAGSLAIAATLAEARVVHRITLALASPPSTVVTPAHWVADFA